MSTPGVAAAKAATPNNTQMALRADSAIATGLLAPRPRPRSDCQAKGADLRARRHAPGTDGRWAARGGPEGSAGARCPGIQPITAARRATAASPLHSREPETAARTAVLLTAQHGRSALRLQVLALCSVHFVRWHTVELA